MPMKTTVSKRMLTQYTNKLDKIIAQFKEEGIQKLGTSDIESTVVAQTRRGYIQRLEEAIGTIEAATSKVEHALQEYGSLSHLEPNEPEDFEEYVVKAESTLATAFDYVLTLQGRSRALRASNTETTSNQNEEQGALTSVQAKKMELPAIPIPSFGGDIWEWDNFWELYSTSVHAQDVPELYKFHYLLNALEGEARESVRKFQITSGNYSKVVDFLLHKYGNQKEVIQRLIKKFEECSPKSTSLKDQRPLLEQLQAIMAQLEHKGENVDGQWIQKQVLSKFPVYIQRNVLTKKQAVEKQKPFEMQDLLSLIDEVISCEEMVSLYTSKETRQAQVIPAKIKTQRGLAQDYIRVCMYCGENHKSIMCTKYSSPRSRSQYLRDNKLCLICASPKHTSAQCLKRKCFNCQGPHHTSCCFAKAPMDMTSSKIEDEATQGRNTERQVRSKVFSRLKSAKEVNHLLHEDEKTREDAGIYELRSSHEEDSSCQTTFLPTGELTVLDKEHNTLRKVYVLFDTGAEASFIDETLAEELQLPTIQKQNLRLRTFGSQKMQEKSCSLVQLKAWDTKGSEITIDLLTHSITSKFFESPALSNEDINHLRAMNIPLEAIGIKRKVRPQILLGCDKLWSFIDIHKPQLRLPSGLHLIETQMGYLISGQLKPTIERANLEEEDKWDGYWTLDTQVNTLSIEEDDKDEDDEEAKWEKFWTLEAAGTERFCHSESIEQAKIDKSVLQHFMETVEKREDGYYVRLPWKEHVTNLPDNKTIAQRRLVSLWNSLRRDPDILHKYDEVFQDQLRRNVLERVAKEETEYKHLHYLPHQAVITPHKTTTKLRVVYDASAHYRNCPSLNDALHRGPVFLPQLFGVLLRFRMGRIAIISDVEKAFLQVRLHEEDRDATRCLWLQNPKLPPTQDNVIILRFTRVPFGLNASPFLLAATTHYHLDQYKNSNGLTQEIKENLYVDNLIVTLDTTDEALECYRRIKHIFKELSMNIREFVCNDKQVRSTITEIDRSSDLTPKVLGVQWNSLTDQLLISCRITSLKVITKRTVTSAIASVYDPMGWMLPLMHKSKVFLRSLWKDKLDWDTTVTEARVKDWLQICQEMQGFSREVPRFVAGKHAEVDIVAFADASTEAVATCIYLKTNNSVQLLLAKGKLPSIKYQTTIPKLELNAATLAMRVIHSVVKQLHAIIAIQNIYFFTDSDIVYKWMKRKPQRETGIMVANRLKEIIGINDHLIKEGIKVHFGHVPTDQNPADCGTRGLNKEQLKDHYWWNGPSFLKSAPKDWVEDYKLFRMNKEQDDDTSQPSDSIIINQAESNIKQAVQHDDIFECLRGRPYIMIKRITATALKFLKIILTQRSQRLGKNLCLSPLLNKFIKHHSKELDGEEIMIAEKIITQNHQRVFCTSTVLKAMRELNINKDEEGLLRCYGRLGKSCLSDTAKTPYIVLQNSWLAEAIIREHHRRGHPGISHTMALVRQKFWIPKLRAQVTRITRRCLECQRYNNRPYKYPNQGDLPQVRVQQSRPFEHVGLDYFGPLAVKAQDDNTSKCYGAIITCMVTRLIHLDVVSDLSTTAFLNMLRRFFGRRGVPRSITSDNAPTFLLGEEILTDCVRKLQNDVTISREISNREIEWKHITPFAPWQGGFYERLIKTVKQSLYKTLKSSTPTFEEMSTTLIEIEGLLNTRPLVYISSNLGDGTIIRPIDFVQNKITLNHPLEAANLKDEDAPYLPSDEQAVLRTKLQTLHALESSCKSTDKFWNLWRSQYLTSLREKHKLQVGHNNSTSLPKKDDCVLITDPVQPRHSWKMGRIIELVKGKDEETREAVVILPSRRQIRRPINLLVPLELEDEVSKKTEDHTIPPEEKVPETKYNLRTKKGIDYSGGSRSILYLHTAATITMITTILCLCGTTQAQMQKRTALNTIRDNRETPDRAEITERLNFGHMPHKKDCKALPPTLENALELSKTRYLASSCTFFIFVRFPSWKMTTFIRENACEDMILPTPTWGRHHILKRFNFSMAFTNLHKEVQCLMVIMKDNTRTSVEEHLKLTRDAMRRQVEVAETIRNDYKHLKEELPPDEEPMDQKIITTRLLQAAYTAKEKYLTLGTRYALLYKYYDLHFTSIDGSRPTPQGFDNAFVQEMDYRLKEIENIIKKIEKKEQEIEHWYRLERSRTSNTEKKIIRSLGNKMRRQDHEIFELKAAIARKDFETKTATTSEAGTQTESSTTHKSPQEENWTKEQVEENPDLNCSEMEIDDFVVLDEYKAKEPEKVVEHPNMAEDAEKAAPEKPVKDAKVHSKEEEQQIEKKRMECRRLAQSIDELERMLQVFPHRRYGETEQGTHVEIYCAFCRAHQQHYSDSCPNITNAIARRELARWEDLCPQCLDRCPPDHCRFKPRPCFYCERIRNTIVARLIPEGEHHKALCSVPDEKNTLKRWLAEARERYAYLRWELATL